MSAEVLYITGEEIQAGDRAQHRGTFGTIVVVSTGERADKECQAEDYESAFHGETGNG